MLVHLAIKMTVLILFSIIYKTSDKHIIGYGKLVMCVCVCGHPAGV